MGKTSSNSLQADRDIRSDLDAMLEVQKIMEDEDCKWAYAAGAKCFWDKKTGEPIKWLDTHEEAYNWLIHNLATKKLASKTS